MESAEIQAQIAFVDGATNGQLWTEVGGGSVQRMAGVSSDGLSMRHVPASSQARLVEIMDALNPDVVPSQQVIAELMDMSPRTLQRRLTDEGGTFFGVIDRWRMGRAMQLLLDPRLPVSEIAARLHYSKSSHFSRVFRRWTGMKPNEFRESELL